MMRESHCGVHPTIFSTILSWTIQPAFIAAIKKKPKGKSKEKSNKSIQPYQSSVFNLIPLPSKPELTPITMAEQLIQSFQNENFRLNRGFSGEHALAMKKQSDLNFRKFCEANQKFANWALNRCSLIEREKQIINEQQRQKRKQTTQSFCFQLGLQTFCNNIKFQSPSFERSSAKNIQPVLLKRSPFFLLELNNQLTMKILCFASLVEEQQKLFKHQKHQGEIKNEEIALIEYLKERVFIQFKKKQGYNEDQDSRRGQLAKLKRQFQEEIIKECQISLPCLSEQRKAFRQFKEDLKKKIQGKRTAAQITGRIVYEIEEKRKNAGQVVLSALISNSKMYQSSRPARKIAKKPTNQSNKIEILRKVKPEATNQNNMRKIKHGVKICENQHFQYPFPNNKVLLRGSRIDQPKKLEKLSLFEQKRRQIYEYIYEKQGVSDFSTLRKSKKKREHFQKGPHKNEAVYLRTPTARKETFSFHQIQEIQDQRRKAYPIIIDNLIIESSEDCSIEYRVEDVRIKELTLRFLTDRRKYRVNKVKIICPLFYTMPPELKHKTMKTLQVLNCLGAVTSIEEAKLYANIPRQQNIMVIMVSYKLDKSVAKVWSLYSNRRKS